MLTRFTRRGERGHWVAWTATTLLATALGVPGAMAAETENSDDRTGGGTALDEINVEADAESATGPVDGYIADRSETATKTDIPLIESPQSISVISREQMEDRGADSLGEAVTYSPGINVDNGAAADVIDSFSIEIRGFSAQNATYRDGTQMQAGLPYDAPIETYGLERVEVLRGPSSVLYGQGEPGGVINMVSKRPTDKPLRELGVEIGSYNHTQVTGDFSDRIDADGNWSYRLTGLAQESDSYQDHVNQDRVFFAPALTWSPSDRTDLTLLARYQKNETRYPWTAYPREGTQYPSEHGTIPDSRYIGEPSFDRYDSTEYAIGYILDHEIDDRWTFRQSVRYREVEYDVLDTFRNYFGAYVDNDLRNLINRYNRARYDEGETTTVDNRLISNWRHGDIEHTVLAGIDYKTLTYDRRDSGFDPISGPASSLDLYDPQYGQSFSKPSGFTETTTEAEQTGLYLQDHINVGDNWAFSLGARKDWVTENSTGEDEKDQDALSLRGGVVYLAGGGWAPYFTYSESFSPQYGQNPVSGKDYDPITGKQYEAGIRYQPPGAGVSATAAVFDIRKKNQLIQNPDNPGNSNDQIQAGETKSQGIELSLLADLTSNLQATASYTRQEVTLVEADANEGNYLREKPKDLAKFWLDYTVSGGPMAGLGVGAGIRHTGESYANAANTAKNPSATLVDAAVRYNWTPGLQLKLTANNLFDTQPVYCSGGAPGEPEDTCYYGKPREIVASATYRW